MQPQTIQTGAYNGPEGPYRSPWTASDVFLIRTPAGYATVCNGSQPDTGTAHASLRDARAWLRDNGFSLKNS